MSELLGLIKYWYLFILVVIEGWVVVCGKVEVLLYFDKSIMIILMYRWIGFLKWNIKIKVYI